jgi:hypothetical protein
VLLLLKPVVWTSVPPLNEFVNSATGASAACPAGVAALPWPKAAALMLLLLVSVNQLGLRDSRPPTVLLLLAG